MSARLASKYDVEHVADAERIAPYLPAWAETGWPIRHNASGARGMKWANKIVHDELDITVTQVEFAKTEEHEWDLLPVRAVVDLHDAEETFASDPDVLDAIADAFRRVKRQKFAPKPAPEPAEFSCSYFDWCVGDLNGCDHPTRGHIGETRWHSSEMVRFNTTRTTNGIVVEAMIDDVEVLSVDNAHQLLAELKDAAAKLEELLLGPDAEVKLTPSTAVA